MYIFTLLGLSSAEKWSTGGITTLIGLGMTFVMLALLIGAIHLLRLILKGLDKANPIIKSKLQKVFRKKSAQGEIVDSERNVAELAEEKTVIDEETMSVIEQSVKTYVAATATDGKPHDRIKIVSVKEKAND